MIELYLPPLFLIRAIVSTKDFNFLRYRTRFAKILSCMMSIETILQHIGSATSYKNRCVQKSMCFLNAKIVSNLIQTPLGAKFESITIHTPLGPIQRDLRITVVTKIYRYYNHCITNRKSYFSRCLSCY